MKRLAPTTRRVVALSLLAIVLLAGLTPGHAAAQPPAPEATYEPIILFSSATLNVWPESTRGMDGGSFYQRFTFPQSIRGVLTMTGYSPETGLFTQDAYSHIN